MTRKNSILVALFLTGSLYAKAFDNDSTSTPLHQLQKAVLAVTVNDYLSPVVVSRVFVYPNIAFLKIISPNSNISQRVIPNVQFQPTYFKTATQQSLCATYAFITVATAMLYTQSVWNDSIAPILKYYRKIVSITDYDSCKNIGERFGKIVIEYMKTDGYFSSRHLPKYQEKNVSNEWRPTYPGYFAAIEPHWGKVNTLMGDNKFKEAIIEKFKPYNFDTAVSSLFYKDANEVYQMSKSNSNEQIEIANFWDCNPFAVYPNGHKNELIKKISPVGHWVCIAQNVMVSKNLALKECSEIYALTTIAMFDALIYCCELKYYYKTIRPEQYLNVYLDANWNSLIQSPPFPEYPSGHSVVSTSAATVLTYKLENISFTDNSEVIFGLKERAFNNFKDAANEAAISRLYGGIHFKKAIEDGKILGNKIAEDILLKIY